MTGGRRSMSRPCKWWRSGLSLAPHKHGPPRLRRRAEPFSQEVHMSRNPSFAQAPAKPRHHWSLYILFAFLGALVTFVGARAEQKASDDATFRKLIDGYCAAWSTGNADNAAKFYAKEDGLVFYDITPFSYHSWKDYHDGVKAAVLDNMASGSLTAGKDLKVHRRGTI